MMRMSPIPPLAHPIRQPCWLLGIAAMVMMMMMMVVVVMCPAIAKADRIPLQQGDWLVRGMVMGVFHPSKRSAISPTGGEVDIPNSVYPTIDISYFLTSRWSIGFLGGITDTDYTIRGARLAPDSPPMDVDVGNVKSASVSLTAQYHFRAGAVLRPYLGLGVSHTWSRDVDPARGIPDFDMKTVTSPTLNAGVDYPIEEHWFASASVRYLPQSTYTFDGEGFGADIEMDTLVVGAGLGYRF